MAFPVVITIIAGTLAVSGIVAVVCWKEILDWAENSLFPWMKKNLPSLEDLVRSAFSFLDQGAVLVRNAWKKLREFLLKQVVQLEKQSSKWIKKVTSWIIKLLDSGKPVPVKVETEEELEWEELPPEVREAFLRSEQSKKEINVTEIRDQEIMEMEMSN